MRGIVTLVTALALPATFPHRDLILFAAFAVTFGTLTIQGQTLRPLMLRLRLASDDVVEREVQSAASCTPSALPLGTRQKAARLRFVSRACAG
jgi:CPA1 family monovalent cation:H+ antiporter